MPAFSITKSSRPSELKSPATIPKSSIFVGKIHGRFRLEGTVSVSQQNCKHPRAYTILEAPINEISLGRLIEVACGKCPRTVVATRMVVHRLLERAIAIT
jgi:hypothetical protein